MTLGHCQMMYIVKLGIKIYFLTKLTLFACSGKNFNLFQLRQRSKGWRALKFKFYFFYPFSLLAYMAQYKLLCMSFTNSFTYYVVLYYGFISKNKNLLSNNDFQLGAGHYEKLKLLCDDLQGDFYLFCLDGMDLSSVCLYGEI